jgi:hypothetical protein
VKETNTCIRIRFPVCSCAPELGSISSESEAPQSEQISVVLGFSTVRIIFS